MRLADIKRPLREGGNAIKSSSRINQENVDATMNDIYTRLLPKLKIDQSDTRNLGSTGKKAPGDSSGDVDLAVSVQTITQNNGLETPKDLYDFIFSVCSEVSHEVKDMRGIGLVSCAWPIANVDGLQDGEFVQLDLMTVDSIDWAEWAYYSPKFDQSPWKGLYRNEILYALARYMNYETISRAMTKDGQEVDAEWKRDFFDLGKGLLTGTQSRMGKKGIIKSVKMINKELKSRDPREVVKMMFGPDATPDKLLTWEDGFKAVMDPNFVYADKRKEILSVTKQGILNKGYPVPPELDAIVP